MGVWGRGLYADDFAMDLRSAVRAVCRLPYEGDRVAELLAESEPAANHPEDENHAIFWLVLADQFARRGVRSDRTRERALALIDSDADGAMRRKLGANAADLASRRKKIEEIRERILAAPSGAPKRAVLQKPQPLLMETGDVLLYPTFRGRCRNPYFAAKEDDRMGTATPSWTQDSWAAMVIIDCGRAFGFLAWYRPITVVRAKAQKPCLAELMGELAWKLRNPGTISTVHFRRMELEKIGRVAVEPAKLASEFPGLKPGVVSAVSDISIANGLNVLPPDGPEPSLRDRRWHPIDGLTRILSAGG